jgi:cysteinyl-tRNA synthetase
MTRPLNLYNTLTERIEPVFAAAPPEVRMYICGPTVYARAHIGNFRTFVASDLLRRTLLYKGYQVREVMNLTDVDDRIIQLSSEAGTDLQSFTAEHVRSFEADMQTLRMQRPEVMPRATAHIPQMVELISRLIERGHTYTAEGSVYFRIGSFAEYGGLSRLDSTGVQAGPRVDTDKYEKENARDFVLWKAKHDEPPHAQWDAAFGRGRPGWHIECSAMSMAYLGESFDLHCGGIDLIFPHHENEIAQSTCGTGKPFVRHWMHVLHLLVEGETMSKSRGNVYSISDVLARGYRADALRYVLCQTHYRRTTNFTWEGMDHATAALARVHGLWQRLGEAKGDSPVPADASEAILKWSQAFDAALGDDLNTAEALAAVHWLVTEGNTRLAEGGLSVAGAQAFRQALSEMDSVFGVLVPAKEEERLTSEEQALFDARQAARARRDFKGADELRAQLEALGIVLEDTPAGTRWRRER